MKFICDACGQRLEVADEYVGQLISCPSCNSEVTIPTVSALTEEFEAAVKESMESTPSGMTIAQFMAERDIESVNRPAIGEDEVPDRLLVGKLLCGVDHQPSTLAA